MTNERCIRLVMAAALLAAFGVSQAALAQVAEVEPNDPVSSAQALQVGSSGSVQVTGQILSTSTHRDVDFYSFQGKAGDVVTADIDGGMNANGTGVDTNIAIFGPNGTDAYYMWRFNDDAGYPLDDGSVSPYDARIDNFTLPADGTYYVGVSSYPGTFTSVSTLASNNIYFNSNGTYTLIISGVTPSVQQINIDIKPGHREFVPLRTHARESIPVALLSSADFDALAVDHQSLRFGETGTEKSLIHCARHGIDVNHDHRPDLICTFAMWKANFRPSDVEGIVTGTTGSGMAFEGHGPLKVLAGKRHFSRDLSRHHSR